ncbi:hypothetical protein OJE16_20730 [Pantoea tagorei]
MFNKYITFTASESRAAMLLEKPTTRRKFLLGSLLALPLSDLVLKGLTAAQAAEMAAPELADYKPGFF